MLLHIYEHQHAVFSWFSEATLVFKTSRSMASEESANISADFEVLTESDIPGASLNGKKPNELNVVQLKRWLSCRGAPTGGKKPQLIERLAYQRIISILCVLT